MLLIFLGYLDLSSLSALSPLLSAFMISGDLSLVLFLLTFIMTLKSDKSSRNLAIYYMVLGFVYYAVTSGIYILSIKLGDGGDLFSSLSKSMFPDNYLLSISAFIFLYFFLFYEPAFKKPTSTKHKLFRSCSIIPLLYILLSYVFSALSETGIISFPYLVEALLSGQSFIQEILGLILIYTFYFLRQRDLKAGKTPKEISEYSHSFQNILISAIVVGLSILDWILCTFIPQFLENATLILQIGDMKWSFVLLPFLVFYNNDESEEKHPVAAKVLDWYYTGAYLLLAIVYAILIINVPVEEETSSSFISLLGI
jgi:hypothetical protein